MTETNHVTPTIDRKPSGRVARWFAGAPKHLYHARLGRLLGRRFVLLEHTGRRSGLIRETVLEVIRRDDVSFDVVAAHGPTSDWYRNLVATPAVRVSTGAKYRVAAVAATVNVDTARAVFTDYARDHPRAARFLSKALGLPAEDPEQMARAFPVVRITLQADR